MFKGTILIVLKKACEEKGIFKKVQENNDIHIPKSSILIDGKDVRPVADILVLTKTENNNIDERVYNQLRRVNLNVQLAFTRGSTNLISCFQRTSVW